jgi:hypothetical protein
LPNAPVRNGCFGGVHPGTIGKIARLAFDDPRQSEGAKMKTVLALFLVAAALAGPATSAFCEEKIQATVTGDKAEAVDCSKQVWPNFSPTCLRNVGQAAPVRIITADRR